MCDDYRNAVRKAVTDLQPDVVHFDTLSLAPYLDAIGGLPAVLNHHNIESIMLLRRAEQENNPFKRVYLWQEAKRLAAYERLVASRFRQHLVCANLDAERLQQTVGDVPTSVVPNGVDLMYFQPAPPATEQLPNSLIFVGGLSWYPNISAIRFFLKEVWPALTAAYPEILFRIIGRNPPPDILAMSKRDRRIQVLGFVDDIRPLFHEAMVFVCPIFDGGGTKLKMLDAMAMGKAIVAHPVACEGLDLTHGHHVLMATSGADFTQQIARLLDNDAERKKLEQNSREYVSARFSFASIGRDLSRIYVNMSSPPQSNRMRGVVG